jgi:hypothetical protein
MQTDQHSVRTVARLCTAHSITAVGCAAGTICHACDMQVMLLLCYSVSQHSQTMPYESLLRAYHYRLAML